jgi:hypothetical protein
MVAATAVARKVRRVVELGSVERGLKSINFSCLLLV